MQRPWRSAKASPPPMASPRCSPWAAPAAGPITNPEGGLFSIAHHAAWDFLRRQAREETQHSNEDLDMIAAVRNPVEDRQIVAASLRTFMRLPVSQRSSVVLSDVLG